MVTNDGLFTPGSYRPMRYTFVIWVVIIVGGTEIILGAILGGFVVWFLWVEAAPIALFLINFFTAHLSETNALKVHLIESAPYFRFLMIGIGVLLIMRYRPQGILPENYKAIKMKRLFLTCLFIIISTNLLALEKDTNFTIEDFKKAQNDGKTIVVNSWN